MFLKDLEKERPSVIIDIIHSGEAFEVNEQEKAKAKVQRESARYLTYWVLGVEIGWCDRNVCAMWIYLIERIM